MTPTMERSVSDGIGITPAPHSYTTFVTCSTLAHRLPWHPGAANVYALLRISSQSFVLIDKSCNAVASDQSLGVVLNLLHRTCKSMILSTLPVTALD
jgi:hypothetical protein